MRQPWKALYWLLCGAVLLFLLAPIAAIVPLSFSSGSFLAYPLPGWSLRWYHEVLVGGRWLRALGVSLFVGTAATALSVVLGTLAALGLARTRTRWAAVVRTVMLAPMILPVILIAVGAYFFLAPLALTSTFTGLILAHTVIAVPFVVLPVLTALELLENYAQLKEAGIRPYWCVHHGITVSMYYADPDGNQMEFQVDAMPSNEAANAFMQGPRFAVNPIGVEYDPDAWLARWRAGEPEAAFLERETDLPVSPVRGPATATAQ